MTSNKEIVELLKKGDPQRTKFILNRRGKRQTNQRNVNGSDG